MKLLLHIFLDSLVLFVAGRILDGVNLVNYWAAVVVAIVLGFLNFFIVPVIKLLTLPINILTLGIFGLVINTLVIMFAAWLVPGFEVVGFWAAFWFSILVSIMGWVINMLID